MNVMGSSPGTGRLIVWAGGPQETSGLASGAGVGGTLALPTWPIFTLSLRGPAPRKPETPALGCEGSLVTSGLLGGENFLKLK